MKKSIFLFFAAILCATSASAWSYKTAANSWKASSSGFEYVTMNSGKSVDVLMLKDVGDGVNICQNDDGGGQCLYCKWTKTSGDIFRGTARWNNGLYCDETVVIPEGKVYITVGSGTQVQMTAGTNYTYTADVTFSCTGESYTISGGTVNGATIKSENSMPSAGKPASLTMSNSYTSKNAGNVHIVFDLKTNKVTETAETPTEPEPEPTPDPAETETVYFVNAEDWDGTINVYAWTDSPKVENAGWPGAAATKEANQIAGHDVYSFTAEKGKFAKVIFNNNNGKQTGDLAWTAGQYICKNEWCADEAAVLAKLTGPVEYESVYFINVKNWTAVNIYTWSPEIGTWPGKAMTKEENQIAGYDVYSYTVEKGTTFGGMKFNEGNGKRETGNLTWATGKYYVVDLGWLTKEEAEAKLAAPLPEVWNIVGDAGLMGSGWDLNDAKNAMTLQADGTYLLEKKDITITAGSYEYKAAKDHGWDVSVPSGNTNQKLTISKSGIYDVTFVLDVTAKKLTATATLKKEAVVIPTVVIAGDMNSWNQTKDKFTMAADSLTATFKTTLAAKSYGFKMIVGGAWLSDGKTITRANNSTVFTGANSNNNTKITADIAGEYTFTWTYETKTLTVSYPVLPIYTVTIAAENGTVEGLAADGKYEHGTKATLTATPAEGYEFVNWTVGGKEVSAKNPYTFTVTADVALVANFAKKVYTVTIAAENGTVEGLAADGKYEHGAEATLTATPAEGYEFVNWTKGEEVVSTVNPYKFTVTADVDLVANFKLIPPTKYNVTVTAENGTVEGAGEYEEGKTATLTATPAEGYQFVNWTKGEEVVSTENPYTFTVTADIALVANFQATEPVVELPVASVRAWAYDLALAVEGEQYTFSYKATTAALATLIFTDVDGEELATKDLGLVEAGANTVVLAADELPAGQKVNWAVKLEAGAIANVVEVTDQSRGIYDFYNMMDVLVDNNPESEYFGRIYIQMAYDGANDAATDRSAVQKAGFYLYDQALNELNPESNVSIRPTLPEGYTMGDNRNKFHRLDIDPKTGNLTWCYNVAGKPAVFAVDAANLAGEATNLVAGIEGISRTAAHCFDAEGALYVMDLPAAGTIYKIVNGVATVFAATDSKWVNASMTLAADGKGGLWVAQNRGQLDSYYQLAHVTSAGVIDWSVYDNLGTFVQNQTPGTSSTGWTGGATRGALAYDAERKLLAQGRNGVVEVYSVAYDAETGVPALTLVATTPSVGTNIDGLHFDYAGDLYVVNSSKEKFQKFAMPTNNNVCTTPAASKYAFHLEGEHEVQYEVYEDEITNLVFDLESMTCLGGPSANFSVDVFLVLGEDNGDGTYALTEESSISVQGSDAKFISGYLKNINAYAPKADAVIRCEWNSKNIEFHIAMSSAPIEATVVVVENAVVEVEKHLLFGDTYDYSLKMTGTWTDAEGLDYSVLVEIPVYYPEATEPSEVMSTVTVGSWDEGANWLGFGEGTLTVTTVGTTVTAAGIVENPMAGIAIDITISGSLSQGPGTALENATVVIKSIKKIQNGQLIIVKDDVQYNAQGAVVK